MANPKLATNKNLNSKFVSLKSIRNLRSWFRDAASEDIQEVIEQLERLKREKLNEEDQKLMLLSEQKKYSRSYHSSHNNTLKSPFDPQDILEALIDRLSCRTTHYRSARVKYRFLDLQGNLCEWSGQGREPIKLRELLAATGKTRDDFLVQNDSENFLKSSSE